MTRAPDADLVVQITGDPAEADQKVSIVGGQILTATPGDVGKVVTVDENGDLALGDSGTSPAELAADPAFTGAYAPLGAVPWRFKSGLYYASTSTSVGTTALVQGDMRVSAFVVGETTTFDRIGAEVTGAGETGARLRLGVYADTGALYPGALVLDAGQVAADAIAGVEATISLELEPGVYWLAAVPQACPTTPPTIRTNGLAPAIGFGVSSLTHATTAPSRNAYQQLSVTGALPSTFTTSVTAQGSGARVALRAA